MYTKVIAVCLLFPQTEQIAFLIQSSFAATLVSKVRCILFMKTFWIFLGAHVTFSQILRNRTYIYDKLQNRVKNHMTEQVNLNYSLSQNKT